MKASLRRRSKYLNHLPGARVWRLGTWLGMRPFLHQWPKVFSHPLTGGYFHWTSTLNYLQHAKAIILVSFFFANRSWILPCHRTQSLFEILTITQHFDLSESNLHSVSLSLSRIHLTNSKGKKDVKMIAYSEQQWKGWRKTRRGKMSEKMKREEKLQSQQLNGDFTVRTWISSLWSRSIINKLQGNSICKKTWICSLHISWQQSV